MKLIFIYGPPASGKLTVAKLLSERTGYKLFHNHLTVDLVNAVFDFGSRQFRKLNEQFRITLFGEAALSNIKGVIFTFVYGGIVDNDFIERVISAVEDNGGKVIFIKLNCSKKELFKRVTNKSRQTTNKINKAEILEELFTKYNLTATIPYKKSLNIDNTNTPPKKVVDKIIEYVDD
jgi:shikimate kinase